MPPAPRSRPNRINTRRRTARHALREAIAADFTRRYGVPVDRRRTGHRLLRVHRSDDGRRCCRASIPETRSSSSSRSTRTTAPTRSSPAPQPKYVRLREPDWRFDPDELTRAFSNRTRAIVINSPNNPTGKVFTRDELQLIAELCQRWDVLAISDEIYERIVFDGHSHVPMASLPGMADRTVTTSGLSKTYSVTGWRIGWAISPPALTGGIRKIHDFLTVAAPTPFHDAGVAALSMPDTFYAQLVADYQSKRNLMVDILQRHGFDELPARRRVLRDGRRQPVRVRVGFRVRAVPGQGRGRGHRSRQQLLCRSVARRRNCCGSVSRSATRRCTKPIDGWRGCRSSPATASDAWHEALRHEAPTDRETQRFRTTTRRRPSPAAAGNRGSRSRAASTSAARSVHQVEVEHRIPGAELFQNGERVAARKPAERQRVVAKILRNVIAVAVDQRLPVSGRQQHVFRVPVKGHVAPTSTAIR